MAEKVVTVEDVVASKYEFKDFAAEVKVAACKVCGKRFLVRKDRRDMAVLLRMVQHSFGHKDVGMFP